MIRFHGHKEFMNNIASVSSGMLVAGKAGLYKAGNAIMRDSKMQVPHDTGALSQTGIVEKTKKGVELSYDTPYAWRVHEGVEIRFRKGRKAKYLEDPIKAHSENIATAIAEAIRAIL